MSNLPEWARVATSTPALRKRFGAAIRSDSFFVEANDDPDQFIGKVTKIGKHRFAWEVWETKRDAPAEGTNVPLDVVVGSGRSRSLLKAISRSRLEYGLYHARRDAERELQAAATTTSTEETPKPKRAPRKPKVTQAEAA